MVEELAPLSDYVLIKLLFADTPRGFSIGELTLDTRSAQHLTEARVLRVGPGRYCENGTLIPMRLTPGDIVVYSKLVGIPVSPEGDVILVKEDALVGKVNRRL